ncbi:MAG: glycerol-3-phosphate dehydrogenase/oxidase [Fuerstiella sp.]
MMIRDVRQLRTGPFDVLIIGGGIYGSWMARHAATAGLKVALVEQSDWASATSSASSKLLHGGLRYLERFEFGLVRRSLHERRELNRIMPHHVRPLRFLLPVYRDSRVGRLKLKAGLWLYDRLAGSDQPVAGHQSYSASELMAQEPGLSSDQLLGGFSYGDCGTDDARMVLEVVDSAISAGAAACNYVTATELLQQDNRVCGAVVRDEETNEQFRIKAAVVVNAAGPWIYQPAELRSEADRVRLTKGVHLVMPPLQSDHAVLLTARSDGRVFFLIPWYGRTLLGTTDTDFDADPSSARVEEADIHYLLNAANDYLRTPWTVEDIGGAFCGLRTLQNESGLSASSVSREWLLEETRPGLFTSIGGKYTSARVDSLEAAQRVLRELHRWGNCTDRQLDWFPPAAFVDWQKRVCEEAVAVGIDRETALNGTRRFGARLSDVIAIARDQPALAKRIHPDFAFCMAEVAHTVSSEMARTLVDILRRRIPLMLLTGVDRATVAAVSDVAGDLLNWTPERRQQETDAVLQQTWSTANSSTDPVS